MGFNRWTVSIVTSIFLVSTLISASCGGGDSSTSVITPAAGLNEIESKATNGFSFVEDIALTPGLSMDISRRNEQVIVSIVSSRDRQLDSLMFELNYDPNQYNPQVVHATEEFCTLSDSLVLEILNEPGVISFGQIPVNGDINPVITGEVLANVLFTTTESASVVRTASEVPIHTGAICPLTYDSENNELALQYVNAGDYDQNGQVSISDLVPLGRHFRKGGPFAFSDALSVIDGNKNGQIDIADLSVIGQNWGNNVQQFNVYVVLVSVMSLWDMAIKAPLSQSE